jgi:hypothetical protein
LVHDAAPVAQRIAASNGEEWVLTIPSRRTPDASPALPPELPKGSAHITPLTIEVVVQRRPTSGAPQTLRQTIVRTADRIHVMTKEREWLFERNSRDPRRALASAVEHRSRTIVLYEETDLRMMLGIRGWVDVLSLGFDVEWLAASTRTEDVRTQGGIRFARYAASRPDVRVMDLWWCEEQVLPGRFSVIDTSGKTQLTVERIRSGADSSLLVAPEERFPNYRVTGLAEWLEHH